MGDEKLYAIGYTIRRDKRARAGVVAQVSISYKTSAEADAYRDRFVATWNAFHGSDIPTEKIPVGIVPRLLTQVQQLVDAETRGEYLAACIKLRDLLREIEGPALRARKERNE